MNTITLNQRTGFDAPDKTYQNASDFHRDKELLEAYLKLAPIKITRAVYASVDDMVAEVRQKMKPYLPEDFDYAYYIGLHSGAEWG